MLFRIGARCVFNFTTIKDLDRKSGLFMWAAICACLRLKSSASNLFFLLRFQTARRKHDPSASSASSSGVIRLEATWAFWSLVESNCLLLSFSFSPGWLLHLACCLFYILNCDIFCFGNLVFGNPFNLLGVGLPKISLNTDSVWIMSAIQIHSLW